MRGAQPSQSDRDKSADRGFGRQTASCCEGAETVARKLARHDITLGVAGLCGLGQQISDEVRDDLRALGSTLVHSGGGTVMLLVTLVLNVSSRWA